MNTFVYKELIVNFKTRQILRNDREFTLDPKAFNTLFWLIDKQHRIVSNDELIENVWDNRPTSNDVVIASIGRVRKLFKEAGINEEAIRTVHKVGYQFILKQDSKPTLDSYSTEPEKTSKKRLSLLITTNLAILIGLSLLSMYLLIRFDGLIDDFDFNGDSTSSSQQTELSVAPLTNKGLKKPTELFFIRHADKITDGNYDDPPLSPVGVARAKRWHTFFEGIQFDEIHTTRFIRNTQTVDFVFGKDLPNLHYYSALLFDIATELEKFRGKKVAIIGHSNTIPGMVNRLVTDRQFDAMDHVNYELIYHVVIDSSGGVSVNQYQLDYILEVDVLPKTRSKP